ncbi:MAG: polysaccharide deacetylase family protein [Clostridiales bacterium]|nr:polysaccharide deacetylase family protein [Clostridiales bacterium]
MKRRRIALLMTSVFLLGNLSIACSSKSESTSTAGNTSVIVASGSEATTTEGSSEETTTTLATEMSTRNADDGTGHKNASILYENVNNPIDRVECIRDYMLADVAYYNSLNNVAEDTWCYILKDNHEQSGSYEYFNISEYNAFYIDKNVTDDDKVVYLTFDCGYPSNRTAHILDILKAHNVKANFFVTKMYLEECSDYCVRMKQEGHMVCNHTVSHTDLTVRTVEDIIAEILDVEEYFYEKTGYEIDHFFRPPTGSYTKRLLSIVRDAGYTTVFWSFALYDYDQNNQPKPGEVLASFERRHHNGAVILMHNDSSSNENELDSVLTYMESQGYRFALLDEVKVG